MRQLNWIDQMLRWLESRRVTSVSVISMITKLRRDLLRMATRGSS